jgi:hypothetical protein
MLKMYIERRNENMLLPSEEINKSYMKYKPECIKCDSKGKEEDINHFCPQKEQNSLH